MPVRNRGTESIHVGESLPQASVARDAAVSDQGSVPPGEPGAAHHELRLLQALRRITRALELHSREPMALYSVTGPQLSCLLAVKERGPMNPTAIAGEIHLSTSTVVGILDRLEEKGLVRRERDRVDRRQVYVAATEKGLALAALAPSPLQETLATALTGLPDPDRTAIIHSLERVAVLMEAHDLSATSARGPSTRRRKSGGAPPPAKEEVQ